MASLVLGAVGAAIGSTIPGTLLGMSFTSIGWSLGSTLGSMLFKPKGQDITQEGSRLGDLKVQSSTYGNPLPIIYGSMRVAGNVIWSTDIIETRHTSTQSSGGGKGGGGGGSKVTTVSYTYSQSFAVAIGEGPITGVRKIWANGNLIYNLSDTVSVASVIASNASASGIRIYTGSESQTADSLIQANVGASNAPAYRGTAYVVFENLQLADYGNRMPNVEFEVMSSASVVESRLVAQYASSSITVNNIGKSGSFVHATNIAVSNVGSAYTYTFNKYRIDYAGARTLLASFPVLSRTIPPQQPIFATPIKRLPDSYLVMLGYSGADFSFLNDGEWEGSIPGIQLGSSSGLLLYAIYAYGYVYARWGAGSNISRMVLGGEEAVIMSTAGYSEMIVDEAGNLFGRSGSSVWRLDENLSQLEGPWTITFSVSAPLLGKDGNDWYFYDTYYSGTPRTHRIPDGGTYSIDQANRTEYWWGYGGNFTYVSPGLTLGYSTSIPGWAWVSLLPSLQDGAPQLQSIVSDICERAGLAAGEIDVTALTDEVHGYVVQRSTGRAQIEQLMRAFYFDAVESGGKVKFVKRGASPAITIAEDDLAAHEYGSAPPDTALVTRTQEMELPLEMDIQYLDTAAAYQVGAQYSQRLTTESENKVSQNFAIAMSASKAKQIADVLMYDAWTARTQFDFQTGWKYGYLEPTDVVDIVKAGRTYTVRLADEDYSLVSRRRAALEDPSIYTQSGAAAEILAPDEEVALTPLTKLALMDIPLLRDQDDGVGFYAAACGYGVGWYGAQSYKSADAGATWGSFGAGFLNDATIGTATTALGAFTRNIFDETHSVTVVLLNGELASDTEANVLNGANAALLGAEIIQFKTATLVSEDTYTLTGLLRGRRGTEWAASTHAAGERFVLLDAASTYILEASSAEYDLERHYRAATFGGFLDDAETVAFTNTAVAQTPLAPVLLGGGRNAAADITLNWTRRTRIGGGWNNYADVPLGEASESYEVEIWDGSGYATLKRTIAAGTPTASYTAAEQTTDFGSAQSTVYCRVYQLSAAVGRGYKLEGTV